MSIETLKKALEDVQRDEFEDATVIRWTASGRFTYAAIKTPAGWYTTAKAQASDAYQRVPQVVTFTELLKLLRKAEVSKVQVATAWQDV